MEKKNDSLKAFEASILNRLENKGIDTSNFELDVVKFIDEKHQCCLWYGGQVAEVKYKDFLFSLEARGDVIATLLDSENNLIGHARDTMNVGGFYGEMCELLVDDEAIHTAELDGRLNFVNNNWFEIFVQMPDGAWSAKTWVCDHDDLKEATIQMVEDRDYMIDEVAKDLDPDKDREILGRLALVRFGYDVDLVLEDERCSAHLGTFITGYLIGTEEIDMDFWVQYEELLGEKLTYEEYVFVDLLYEGDPLDLEVDGLDDFEVFLFEQIKEALMDYRAGMVNEVAVGLVVEAYKEFWTPDKNDAIYEQIVDKTVPAFAEAVCKQLEDEYSSWFEKADSVDGLIGDAQEKAASYNEAKKLEEHTYGNHIFMRLEVDGEVHEVSNYAGRDGKWDSYKTTADGTDKRDAVIKAFNELY